MVAMAGLGVLWNSIQTWLFPMLEDELGENRSQGRGGCGKAAKTIAKGDLAEEKGASRRAIREGQTSQEQS